MNVHQFVSEYEFRGDGGDHVPTDAERVLIEDAIAAFIASCRNCGDPVQAFCGTCREMGADQTNDLVWRLRHPLLVHGPGLVVEFEKDATQVDLTAAADAIDRITAERDGLLSEVECLNSNARVQAKLLADTGRERDGLRKALEPFVKLADYFDDANLAAGEQPWRDSDIASGIRVGELRAARAALTPSVPDRTIDNTPSCGMENDFRRATSADTDAQHGGGHEA